MSSPRYYWWPYVKSMIRNYPELKRQYGGTAAEGVEPPVRPSTRRREYEAVRQAIETTSAYKNGETRLRMVELMFWNAGNHRTLAGAADKLCYSEERVTQWHGEFIRLVAANFGLMDV